MISNKRDRKKHIPSASTELGNMPALSNQYARSRRKVNDLGGLKSLRRMIVKGRLGIFKLISPLEKRCGIGSPATI